uniref:(California timema) hypothetical protein n=1 Tax=Timema californicum TaxID=61474 RepID=A0A7R9JCJ0_TIMCA|nr:unnamed protein product [Timema californicum]
MVCFRALSLVVQINSTTRPQTTSLFVTSYTVSYTRGSAVGAKVTQRSVHSPRPGADYLKGDTHQSVVQSGGPSLEHQLSSDTLAQSGACLSLCKCTGFDSWHDGKMYQKSSNVSLLFPSDELMAGGLDVVSVLDLKRTLDPAMFKEDSSVPSRLFEDILRQEYPLTVRVKDIRPAVSVGDNYSGQLHRVTLEVLEDTKVTEQRHLVVKTLPQSETMLRYMEEGGTFARETRMYRDTLPAMTRVLRGTPLSPQYYPSPIPNTVIMQDLAAEGYKMADRLRGLDYAHCVATIRALARFHGASVALLRDSPHALDEYRTTVFVERYRHLMEEFTGRRIIRMASVVEGWPGYERFGDKLRNLGAVVFDKLVTLTEERPGALLVLNHNDLWVNNLMFKRSTDGHIDVRFLDFQLCRVTCAVFDLHHLFGTSASAEVRDGKLDAVLSEYHSELSRVLRSVGCEDKVTSLQQLRAEMDEKELYYLYITSTLLSVILDPESVSEVPNVDNADRNPTFRQIFQKVLLDYERKADKFPNPFENSLNLAPVDTQALFPLRSWYRAIRTASLHLAAINRQATLPAQVMVPSNPSRLAPSRSILLLYTATDVI